MPLVQLPLSDDVAFLLKASGRPLTKTVRAIIEHYLAQGGEVTPEFVDGTRTIATMGRPVRALKNAIYMPELDYLHECHRWNQNLVRHMHGGTTSSRQVDLHPAEVKKPDSYRAMIRLPAVGRGYGLFQLSRDILTRLFPIQTNDEQVFTDNPSLCYAAADIQPSYDYRCRGTQTIYVQRLLTSRGVQSGSRSVVTFDMDAPLTDTVKRNTLLHYDASPGGHRPFSREDLERVMELRQISPSLPLYTWALYNYEEDPRRLTLHLEEYDEETARRAYDANYNWFNTSRNSMMPNTGFGTA